MRYARRMAIDEARRPSSYGASSRHAVARLQEICRARTTFAALASPAAARRWRVLEAEQSRVRSATQEVLGRAPTRRPAPRTRRPADRDRLRRGSPGDAPRT